MISSRIKTLNLTEEDEIRTIKNGNIKYRTSISCCNATDKIVQIVYTN